MKNQKSAADLQNLLFEESENKEPNLMEFPYILETEEISDIYSSLGCDFSNDW